MPEGKEKALVMDTGIGIGNIRQKIEELTDKPLIVAMSRGAISCASARRRSHSIPTVFLTDCGEISQKNTEIFREENSQ